MKQTPTKAPDGGGASKTKRAYHSPQLIEYGRIADLTAAKNTSGHDYSGKKTTSDLFLPNTHH